MTKPEKIIAAVKAMPVEQRLHVMDMLIEEVYQSEAEIDEAWGRELERRENALITGEATLLDEGNVLADVRRRL